MSMIERLHNANPGLRIFDVYNSAFQPYGRVLSLSGTEKLSETLKQCTIPENGNCYVASEPKLEQLSVMQRIRRCSFGEMPIQAGYCNGNGFRLNALEYHRCSEVNYSTTGLVLLLALPEMIHDRQINSDSVVGVYLPPDIPVEIWPGVLHFAPCRVRPDGFNCLVVLEQGTNADLQITDPSAPGEEALLWKQNKWLLCHPESPQAEAGAFTGITGENIVMNMPE